MTAENLRQTQDQIDALKGLHVYKAIESSLEAGREGLCQKLTAVTVEQTQGQLAMTGESFGKPVSSVTRTQSRVGAKNTPIAKNLKIKATPDMRRRHLNRETFPVKLLKLLETGNHTDVIHWADDGNTVVIKDKDALEEVLPQYFDHNNIRSLHRQFSSWGFMRRRKRSTSMCVGKRAYEYWYHPNFYHGMPRRRLYSILRTANKGTSTRRGGITINLKKATAILQESGETMSTTLEQEVASHVGRNRNKWSSTRRNQVQTTGSPTGGFETLMVSSSLERTQEIDEDEKRKADESNGKDAAMNFSSDSVEIRKKNHSENKVQLLPRLSNVGLAETVPIYMAPIQQVPLSSRCVTSKSIPGQGHRKTMIPGILSNNVRTNTTNCPSQFIDKYAWSSAELMTPRNYYTYTSHLSSSMRQAVGFDATSVLYDEMATNHFHQNCPLYTQCGQQMCQVCLMSHGRRSNSNNLSTEHEGVFSLELDSHRDILECLPIVDPGCGMLSLEEEDCMSLQDAGFFSSGELLVERGIQVEQV